MFIGFLLHVGSNWNEGSSGHFLERTLKNWALSWEKKAFGGNRPLATSFSSRFVFHGQIFSDFTQSNSNFAGIDTEFTHVFYQMIILAPGKQMA